MRQLDAEVAGASAFFTLGVLTVLGSKQLGIGTATQPGPGFFSSGIGACMALLSVFSLVSAIRQGTSGRVRVTFPNLPAIAALIMALAGYGLLVGRAGFVLTTLAFMLTVQMIAARASPGWRQAVISVAVTATLYLVFQTLLRVGLPAGGWWG